MATINGIPFNGGMDSPTGTGAQNIVETCAAIAAWLVDGSTPAIMLDSGDVISVNWATRQLYDASGVLSVDYANRALILSDGARLAIAWDETALIDAAGNNAVNWGIRILADSASSFPSIDWDGRQLIAEDGSTATLQWGSGVKMPALPTSDPAIPGRLYQVAGAVMISL